MASGIESTHAELTSRFLAEDIGEYTRLLAAMERPDLHDDPRFADPIDRFDQEKRSAFRAIFQSWLDQNTRYDAMASMQAERVPLTAVNPPSAVLNDPHFRDRGYFVEVDHPEAGPLPYTREPFRMAASPAVAVSRAPRLGEHTDTVLRDRLGLSTADLTELRGHGVI